MAAVVVLPRKIDDPGIAEEVHIDGLSSYQAELVAAYLENCEALLLSPGMADDPFKERQRERREARRRREG